MINVNEFLVKHVVLVLDTSVCTKLHSRGDGAKVACVSIQS